MKKKTNSAVIFFFVLLAIGGILYLLGMHETFGVAGAVLTALVLTFLMVFFVSQ